MAFSKLNELGTERKTIHDIKACVIGDIDFTNETFVNLTGVLGVEEFTYSETLPEPQKVYGSGGVHAEMMPETGEEYEGGLNAYDGDLASIEEAFYSSIKNTNGTVQRSSNMKPKAIQFATLVWNEEQAANLPRLYTFYRCMPQGRNWTFTTDSDSISANLMELPVKIGTVAFAKNAENQVSPWLITEYDDAPDWFDAHKYLEEIVMPTHDFTITPE